MLGCGVSAGPALDGSRLLRGAGAGSAGPAASGVRPGSGADGGDHRQPPGVRPRKAAPAPAMTGPDASADRRCTWPSTRWPPARPARHVGRCRCPERSEAPLPTPRTRPATALALLMPTRAPPERPPALPRRKASRHASSTYRKLGAASSCCLGAGWRNDPLPGSHGAVGWSRTTSATSQHSQASTSSLPSGTCSSEQQNWGEVYNTSLCPDSIVFPICCVLVQQRWMSCANLVQRKSLESVL